MNNQAFHMPILKSGIKDTFLPPFCLRNAHSLIPISSMMKTMRRIRQLNSTF
jgi:hypothetical protein